MRAGPGPSPNVRYRIADAQGNAVTVGAIGELQIRSPYLMRGYLDAPELTAAAYQDGWFRTGDLAREVDGQVVELMGRLKEVISRGGNKVTPAEIEQSICSHSDVAAAMAVGIDDALLGEQADWGRARIVFSSSQSRRASLPVRPACYGSWG